MPDKQIVDLDALTSLTADDLLVVADNPSGTNIIKKITIADAFNYLTRGDLTATAPVALSATRHVIGGAAVVSMAKATTAVDGYLSSTDWNTFNDKEPALTKGNLTATSPIVLSQTRQVIGGAAAVSIPVATTSIDGYLSAVDWTTFNAKQAALSFPLASTLGGTGVNNAGTITNATATTITGGGTLALGGFTLTIPATGTAALLGTANVFTAAQVIQPTSDQVIELRVIAPTGAWKNIQTWENSTGVQAYIDVSGCFNLINLGPLCRFGNTATTQWSLAGFRLWNNTASFGDYAGVTITVNVSDGAASKTLFAIDRMKYTQAYAAHLFNIQLDTNLATFFTAVTFNPLADATSDVIIMGDTATNLFWADVSADAIAIGTTVAGNIAKFYPTEVTINEGGLSTLDFRVESDTYDALFVDASNDSVMIMSNVAGKVGFYGIAAIAQPAGAAQVAPAAYVTGVFGLDSGAHMQALFDLVVAMRLVLVSLGIMKGDA